MLSKMTQRELRQLIDRAADEGWTNLDLNWKGLTKLPPEIGQLASLTTLRVRSLTTLDIG